MCMRPCAYVCVGVSESAQACFCERVALIILDATLGRRIFSSPTKFFLGVS